MRTLRGFGEAVYEYIRANVPEEDILTEEPMSRHTTFRIGGEAACFIRISSEEQLRKLIPYFEAASKEVVQRKRILTISVHSEPIDIPVSHILYLEANLRVIIVHLIHDERTEYHFYGNLSDLSKKLEDLGFLRVQRSFLVNMEYIVQLQYEKVSLTGGIVLPSSAKNHKELKQHYLLWRGKKRWAIS